MSEFVLDASVAAKWFLPASTETLSREAATVLRRYTNGQLNFVVPDLFFAEFANVLWKAERNGRCARRVADAAIKAVTGSGFPSFRSSELIEPAIHIARTYGRSVYDAIYLALAIQMSAPMITADEKLANSVAGRLPVLWLGSIHSTTQ